MALNVLQAPVEFTELSLKGLTATVQNELLLSAGFLPKAGLLKMRNK